jgi:LytR cell envelope-related transcriptional attenuator
MTQTMRTTLTLLGLILLLGVMAAWGWKAATKPLPAKVDTAICVDTPVRAGDKVYPQQVTVSVYNAGRRQGLAGRTMQELKDAGFTQGNAGNAPTAKVEKVAIWTTRPNGPDVQLVATYLGSDVKIERRDAPGVGVNVVVGDKFVALAKGERAVLAAANAEICSPPVS